MCEFLGQYGLYQWFEELGVDQIHPTDIEGFRCFKANCKVFHCDGVDGGYLLLRYGERSFRVRPTPFRVVHRPDRTIGETVTLQCNGAIVRGMITDVIWHFERAEPFYHVIVDGKQLSKRYWKDDFITPT